MFQPQMFRNFDSISDVHLSGLDQPQERLTLWRDSLRNKTSLPRLPADQRWSATSAMKKLSYLPTRLSRLTGIRDFFETQANIIIPTSQKSKSKHRNKLFYLIPRNVTITYGPYFYLGILDYRVERLHGLQSALKFAGANVHLRAAQHINHLSIWYLEKEIFSCKITDLHHGGDGELDSLCYDAALAFAKNAKKTLLHVRHKYKFDKEKGNLFKKCPCPKNPFDFDDDDDDGNEKKGKDKNELEQDDQDEEEDGAEQRRHRTSEHEFYGEDAEVGEEDPFEFPDFRNFDIDEEQEGEDDDEDLMVPPTKRMPRIYFKPTKNRIPMNKIMKTFQTDRMKLAEPVSENQEELEEEEYPGENENNPYNFTKGGSRKPMLNKKLNNKPYKDGHVAQAYDRHRVI